MISKEELGAKIKEARNLKSREIGKRYTGQMLADELGISRSYLGDIESGRIYPNIEMLNKIASALDINTSDLLGDSDSQFIVKENPADYGTDELELEFERLKPKMQRLPKEEKEKLIKIINAYLEK